MNSFEWDDTKNKLNQSKHKIAFEDAADIFNDEDGKININIGYVSADKRLTSETDARFDVNVSTKINERITINSFCLFNWIYTNCLANQQEIF